MEKKLVGNSYKVEGRGEKVDDKYTLNKFIKVIELKSATPLSFN